MNGFRVVLILALGMSITIGRSQPVKGFSPRELPSLVAFAAAGSEQSDDPGYALYREGYTKVLDDQWRAACKAFDDLKARYPKSAYADDARYWYAYAMKHIDRKKAREAYRHFVKEYPRSDYYDDALVDLSDLESSMVATGLPPESLRVFVYDLGHPIDIPPLPDMGGYERQLSRNLRRLSKTSDVGKSPFATPAKSHLDPETRVKIEALYALGESREDEKSFQRLKEIAVNRAGNRAVREAALGVLSRFNNADLFSVYIDLAKHDTSEEIQDIAVEYIAIVGKDKNRAVETLIDLFTTVPSRRERQLENILYAVGEIGNERAVDFLSRIARTHENYNLRSDAVYYLGNIGGPKARDALFEVIRDRK